MGINTSNNPESWVLVVVARIRLGLSGGVGAVGPCIGVETGKQAERVQANKERTMIKKKIERFFCMDTFPKNRFVHPYEWCHNRSNQPSHFGKPWIVNDPTSVPGVV